MKYYFGGKFNPVTKGHMHVLEELIEYLNTGPWKNGRPGGDKIVIGIKSGSLEGSEGCELFSSYEYRSSMMYKSLEWLMKKHKNITGFWDAIRVVEQTNPRTWAYLNSSDAQLDWLAQDEDVTLVMGSDEEEDLRASVDSENPKWLHAEEILNRCKVIGFPRDNTISSTRVRQIFRANPYANYFELSDYLVKDVFDYVVKLKLYWQYGEEGEARRKETEFLSRYDITKFPRPSCTATIIITHGDEVLLVRRGGHPYKGFWSLPGGFFDVENDESIEYTATRELEEETGLDIVIFPENILRVVSAPGIDPRGRIVDHVYAIDIVNDVVPDGRAGDDASEIRWWHINELPRMAFNHKAVIEEYYKNKNVTEGGFNEKH